MFQYSFLELSIFALSRGRTAGQTSYNFIVSSFSSARPFLPYLIQNSYNFISLVKTLHLFRQTFIDKQFVSSL